MQRQQFAYHLPEELIAQQPAPSRTDSRLLALDMTSQAVSHYHFHQLPGLLRPGDLLVFNDTQVMPARLFGRKVTGGRLELLVERVLTDRRFSAHIKASKAPQVGSRLYLSDDTPVQVNRRDGQLFECELLTDESLMDVMQRIGHLPLPPYIDRAATAFDESRYQTVYARQMGAVAAPTAGLHFSEALLQTLADMDIASAFVTLHVGAGTFSPVRVQDINQHRMHSEVMHVSTRLCERIAQTKAQGGRVIAVGTTVVRCLESAARSGQLQPYAGETDIFITPGFEFRLVDGLITNFHLPESTLLMLVCAFAGYEAVMNAYRIAVAQQYRFFSYGDAMLLLPGERR
jgi:S-adenosylmethionine:tRNA ribosyltransferase-isomerase